MNSTTFGLSSAWDSPNREIRYRCSFNIPSSTFIPVSPIVVYNDVLDTMEQTGLENFDSSILSIDIKEEYGCDNGLVIGCAVGKQAQIDMKLPVGSAIHFDNEPVPPEEPKREDYNSDLEYERAKAYFEGITWPQYLSDYNEALEAYNELVSEYKAKIKQFFIQPLKDKYVDIEAGCVLESQLDIYEVDDSRLLLDTYKEIWVDDEMEDKKGYYTYHLDEWGNWIEQPIDYGKYEGITIEEVRAPINTEWVHLDRYKVYSIDIDDDYTTASLTCYDKMSELGDKMRVDRSTDGTVLSCVEKIENKYGFSTALRESGFISDVSIDISKEATAKQLIGWLAGLMGYNVKTHFRYSENKYVFSFFKWAYSHSAIDPSAQWEISGDVQYKDECSFDTDLITFDTLKINGYQSGTGKKLMNVVNPFVVGQSIINDVATNSNFQYIQYQPFEVKWIGTPALLETERFYSEAQGPDIVRRNVAVIQSYDEENSDWVYGYIMYLRTHISEDEGFTQTIRSYKSLTQALDRNGITTTQSLLESSQKIGSSIRIYLASNYTINNTGAAGTTVYYTPPYTLCDDLSQYLSLDTVQRGIKIGAGVHTILAEAMLQTSNTTMSEARGFTIQRIRNNTSTHYAFITFPKNSIQQSASASAIIDVQEGDVIRVRYWTQWPGSTILSKDPYRNHLSVAVLG